MERRKHLKRNIIDAKGLFTYMLKNYVDCTLKMKWFYGSPRAETDFRECIDFAERTDFRECITFRKKRRERVFEKKKKRQEAFKKCIIFKNNNDFFK
jgi:hypothetical protein